MIDSVSIVRCDDDDVDDKNNAKMSTQQSQVDVLSETAKRTVYHNVNDGHSMADNEKGEMNSSDQIQSNNNTTNQTNACNIKMDTIETTITADISYSLNGLEMNDVTEMLSPTSSVPFGTIDANCVKYLPTTPSTTTTTATNLSPIILSPCRNTSTITMTINDFNSDDDFEEIQKFFETKTLAIEKWLRERAPQDVLMKMHTATDCVRTPKSPKLRTPSVTSDLFQQWLATSPVQVCHRKLVLSKIE